VSDTFRRDNLRCFGAARDYAPFLDRFAKEAVIFEQAFCGSFPTVPNRNDVMTGRWTFTYKDWEPLSAGDAVLAEILDEAAVLTSAVFDTPHPFRPGFNYQRGFRVWEQIRGQESDRWRSHPSVVRFPCDPSKLRDPHTTLTQYLRNVHGRRDEQDYFCAQTVRTALRWLEGNRRSGAFFLYVDTFDPHEPWDPPQHYIDRYAPDYRGERVIYPRYDRVDFLTAEELEYCRALYRAKVSLVDRWIGFLLEGIHALGLWDETAVLFTTDHGFYLGEHGYIGKSLVSESFQQCLPMYPEVHHIPLLAHVPGIEPHVNRALVQPVDLPATICDLLGVPTHRQFQGHSLLPLARRELEAVRDIAISSPRISGEGLVIPHPSSRSSITDGTWLLVYGSQVDPALFESSGVPIYGNSPDASATTAIKTRMVDDRERTLGTLEDGFAPELYCVVDDPGCSRNLLDDRRDVVMSLHAKFVAFLEGSAMRREHLPYFQEV
jgi:arylsulfatase A-like enzyme